jgi:hypothetical protein
MIFVLDDDKQKYTIDSSIYETESNERYNAYIHVIKETLQKKLQISITAENSLKELKKLEETKTNDDDKENYQCPSYEFKFSSSFVDEEDSLKLFIQYGIKISPKLAKLNDNALLDDAILQFCLERVKLYHKEKRFYFFDVLFYGKIIESESNGVSCEKWYKNYSPIVCPISFIVISQGNHFSLVVTICKNDKSSANVYMLHLDSLLLHKSTDIQEKLRPIWENIYKSKLSNITNVKLHPIISCTVRYNIH